MPNVDHLRILDEGVSAWNAWREEWAESSFPRGDNPRPGLGGADLRGRDLRGVNFDDAVLFRADLRDATFDEASTFRDADLQWADLRGVDLTLANLERADLQYANLANAHLDAARLFGARLAHAILEGSSLMSADLDSADLRRADLRGSHLEGADLSFAILVETRLQGAFLDGCRVYGAAVWNVEVDERTCQRGLVITPRPSPLPTGVVDQLVEGLKRGGLVSERRWGSPAKGPRDEPVVTADDLAVAQFLSLLRHNERLTSVIDAVSAKVVLIIGNFGPERKVVLDAMREELRSLDCVPVIFDFTVPGSRDTDETINLLARMARFIIADVTHARSLPQELKGIVEPLPSVPVQPIVLAAEREYGMFDHIKRYPWVLEPFEYRDLPHLLASLKDRVVGPAEAKARQLRPGP